MKFYQGSTVLETSSVHYDFQESTDIACFKSPSKHDLNDGICSEINVGEDHDVDKLNLSPDLENVNDRALIQCSSPILVASKIVDEDAKVIGSKDIDPNMDNKNESLNMNIEEESLNIDKDNEASQHSQDFLCSPLLDNRIESDCDRAEQPDYKNEEVIDGKLVGECVADSDCSQEFIASVIEDRQRDEPPGHLNSSQEFLDAYFSTQVLRNISLPSQNQVERVVESQNEYDDPMISTQDLCKIQMSQLYHTDFVPKNNSVNVPPLSYSAGPSFGKANGKPITISKNAEIFGNIFLQEQSVSFNAPLIGTRLLRQLASHSSSKTSAALNIPVLVDNRTIFNAENALTKIDKLNVHTRPKEIEISDVSSNAVFTEVAPGVTSEFKSGTLSFMDADTRSKEFGVCDASRELQSSFAHSPEKRASFVATSNSSNEPHFLGFSNASRPFQSPFAHSSREISSVTNNTSPSKDAAFQGFSNASRPFQSPLVHSSREISSVTNNTSPSKDAAFQGFSNASRPFQSPMVPSIDFSMGFQTASKKAIVAPSKEAIAKFDQLINDENKPLSDNHGDHQFKVPLPGIIAKSIPGTPIFSSIIPEKNLVVNTPISTPSSSSKGLLLTPTVTPKSYSKSGIKNTPFKPLSIKKPIENVLRTPGSSLVSHERQKLFNIPQNRTSFAISFPNPLSVQKKIGPWTLPHASLLSYQFPTCNGLKGVDDALQILRQNIFQKISICWVENHYRWILWKLSSLANRLETQQYRWSFDEVIAQLIFRYFFVSI